MQPSNKPQNDKVVQHVVATAVRYASVRKILLFGSRANGRQNEKSDYDFAIEWQEALNDSWGKFTEEVREKSPTLHQIDLVRMDQISQEFQVKILKEGVLVYAKD